MKGPIVHIQKFSDLCVFCFFFLVVVLTEVLKFDDPRKNCASDITGPSPHFSPFFKLGKVHSESTVQQRILYSKNCTCPVDT